MFFCLSQLKYWSTGWVASKYILVMMIIFLSLLVTIFPVPIRFYYELISVEHRELLIYMCKYNS